ncbi:MAG: aminotransferase class I/II-fold pyridoxal phosphate-dependent enzyme [Steroidobacteraceae bacterium]|nr:aminotransferase class I/II-fold pyridoxal phosphate-dependent enzyme [Steroidobacteraceae bacterium]
MRGTDIPPFYASQVGARAHRLRRAGRSVIGMHFGQPTEPPPPGVHAAAHRAIEDGPTGYYESPELRARIARHYLDAYGLHVASSRILLTLGASAGLVATFTTLFASGDRVGVVRPGYPAYRNALRALGREPVEIDCGPERGFRLGAEQVAGVPGELHGLVVASPGNPTGAMLSRAALAEVAGACRARGTQLVSDEIYHGISFTGPATCALEVEPQAIVINSFSKLYRMPGWRLGWIVVPEAAVERFGAQLINLFLTPSTLSQEAAIAAFDDRGSLQAAVAGYARNRATLLAALPTMGLRGLVPPDGAFYLYADVGHLTDDSLAFCHELLEDTGIAIAPGIDFDPRRGQRFVRLSFAVSEAEVDEAIARLRPWLARREAARRSS